MWLPTLLCCLVLVKLSTADFGLPVTIPNLRTAISGTASRKGAAGVEPTENILREMGRVVRMDLFDMDVLFLIFSVHDAIYNMTEIQNNTLNSLARAVNDNQNGPRKVFDRVYSEIKGSQQMLQESQRTIVESYSFLIGSEKFKLLNASQGALQSSLETLQTALIQVDDSIGKAQRTKPVTQESIQKVIGKSQIADLALGVGSLETSISKLNELAESSLKLFKLFDQDTNKTYTQLFEILNFESVFNATVNRTTTIENNLLGVIAKMNSTIVSGYKSIIKSSSKERSTVIEKFLAYFNEVVDILDESASNVRELFSNFGESTLSMLVGYITNLVQFNLNGAAFTMFNNFTFAERCVQKCPLVNESLTIFVNMLEKCILQQLDFLPEVERMVNEFVQPISALMMAPLENFRICSAKLGSALCLRNFTTTHLGNTTDMTSRILRSMMDQRTMELYMVTNNEVASAVGRIEACVSTDDAMASLMELRGRRMACYAYGDSTKFKDFTLSVMFGSPDGGVEEELM